MDTMSTKAHGSKGKKAAATTYVEHRLPVQVIATQHRAERFLCEMNVKFIDPAQV